MRPEIRIQRTQQHTIREPLFIMSSSSRRQRKRQPSSIVGTIATSAVVAYGVYRVADWFWNSNDDDDDDDVKGEGASSNHYSSILSSLWSGDSSPQSSSRARQQQQQQQLDPQTTWKIRRQRAIKCRRETVKAFRSCLPAIRQVIEEATNTSTETKRIKELRKKRREETENGKNCSEDDHDTINVQQEQDELWRRIQVETMTRLVASAYASTLLFLSLTLQIHWVAGQMMMATHINTTPTHQQRHQQILMTTHEYFLHQGLPLLLDTIRRTITTTIDWKPTQFLSLHGIEEALKQVHYGLQYGTNMPTKINKQYPRNWIRFVLPDGENDDCIDALWDIAASPVWEDAQVQTLEATMETVRKDGWEKSAFSEKSTTQQPLAKLIAPFQQASNVILGSSKNTDGNVATSSSEHYLSCLQRLPTVLELGDVSFEVCMVGP